MRHIISILLQNQAGALTRVAGLFSTRGYNIESLSVAPTEDESVSRLTVVAHGSQAVVAQIKRQVLKLVDVVDLMDMTAGEHIERELLLLKLRARGKVREGVRELAARHHAQLIDDTETIYTLQMEGTGEQVSALIKEAQTVAEILEVVRSGATAIAQGDKVLRLTPQQSLVNITETD